LSGAFISGEPLFFHFSPSADPFENSTGVTAAETEGIFQYMVLIETSGAFGDTIEGDLGIGLIINGR
jgi:hypothetical protein